MKKVLGFYKKDGIVKRLTDGYFYYCFKTGTDKPVVLIEKVNVELENLKTETSKALHAEMNRNIQLQEEIERLKETCDFWIGKVRFYEKCCEKTAFTDISGREFVSVEWFEKEGINEVLDKLNEEFEDEVIPLEDIKQALIKAVRKQSQGEVIK